MRKLATKPIKSPVTSAPTTPPIQAFVFWLRLELSGIVDSAEEGGDGVKEDDELLVEVGDGVGVDVDVSSDTTPGLPDGTGVFIPDWLNLLIEKLEEEVGWHDC